jgi:hypothetical protein
MPSLLFTFPCCAVLLLGLVPGCAGGQTGDLSGNHDDPGGIDSSGGCDEHKQKLARFDEMTDQGTAEELLAIAEKSFDAPITWKVAPDGQSWTSGPESGKGTVHFEVTRGMSAYKLSYTQPASQTGNARDLEEVPLDLAAICPPPALGVEAHVSVTTDGGALAESYDTLLRSTTTGVATFSVPLDLAKLGGTLTIEDSKPQGKVVQVSLQTAFTAQGTTGRISGIEQVGSGSGANAVSSASGAVFAVWPDSDACQAFSSTGDGLGVAIDQPLLGLTGEQAMDALASPKAADITWLDGSKTSIAVTIDSTGDGCFRNRDDVPLALDGGPGVSYPVTISLKSADGRLDGHYAGQLDVIGGGSQQRVRASASIQLVVDDAQKSGFTAVSVPAGSDSLLLKVDSMLSGGNASGSVQLFAIASSPCDTTPPMATPGSSAAALPCAGQSQTPLESAAWGD